MQKKISILIPVHNEAGNLYAIHKAVKDFFTDLPQYRFELIFVDDGSEDKSLQEIKKLSDFHENIAFISFSRNFGKDSALLAGLEYCSGDAVVTMDADMQHPPELLNQLLMEWECGHDVVYFYRDKKNAHASFKSQVFSKLFYKTINMLSDIKMQEGISDFRIIDRKVVNALNSLHEENPFVRGLIQWVGFKQKGIPYTPANRHCGDTSYRMKSLIKLALNGITSFSTRPLNIAIYLGFIFSLASLMYIPYVIYSKMYEVPISGWASVIVTIAFFGGLNLMILGILGIYLGKSFMQGKKRPLHIVAESNVEINSDRTSSAKEIHESSRLVKI